MPLRAGSSGWWAAVMPATCVPCEPASTTAPGEAGEGGERRRARVGGGTPASQGAAPLHAPPPPLLRLTLLAPYFPPCPASLSHARAYGQDAALVVDVEGEVAGVFGGEGAVLQRSVGGRRGGGESGGRAGRPTVQTGAAPRAAEQEGAGGGRREFWGGGLGKFGGRTCCLAR